MRIKYWKYASENWIECRGLLVWDLNVQKWRKGKIEKKNKSFGGEGGGTELEYHRIFVNSRYIWIILNFNEFLQFNFLWTLMNSYQVPVNSLWIIVDSY